MSRKTYTKSSHHSQFHVIFLKFFFAVIQEDDERTLKIFVRKKVLSLA